jgi:hypothetical protein
MPRLAEVLHPKLNGKVEKIAAQKPGAQKPQGRKRGTKK